MLHPGDRVLVRNVGLRGKQKLADRWECQPYIVRCQPNPDIPVYEVQLENSRSRNTRTLHRNLLLPFMFIPRMKQQQLGTGSDNAVEAPEDERIQIDVVSSQSTGTDFSESDKSISDAVSQRSDTLHPVPRYVIPTRRPPGTHAVYPRTNNPLVDVQPSSRPVRE